MSGPGRCNRCGGFVIWTDNTHHGKPIPLDPATDRKHICSGSPSGSQFASIQLNYGTTKDLIHRHSGHWNDFSLNEAYTYPTACWWCGQEPVFAHSNGNGDFVLLDPPLGLPWIVHHCYKHNIHKTHGRPGIQPRRNFIHLDFSKNPSALNNGIYVVVEKKPKSNLLDEYTLAGNRVNMSINIDHWRTVSLYLGATVFVAKTKNDFTLIIPLDPLLDAAQHDEMRQILDNLDQLSFGNPNQTPLAGGKIIATENMPSYILYEEGRQLRPKWLIDRQSKLVWIITKDSTIVPVLLKIWYKNWGVLRTLPPIQGRILDAGILNVFAGELYVPIS